MKKSSHFTLRAQVATIVAVCSVPLGANAKWILNSSASTSYTDSANWEDGIVDDTFSGTALPETLTLTLSEDRTLSAHGFLIDATAKVNIGMTAVDGPRTLFFSGGTFMIDQGGTDTGANKWVSFGAQNSEVRRINFDFGAAPAVVSISPSAAFASGTQSGKDAFSIYGSITGASFTKEGQGLLKVFGHIGTEGDVFVRGGAVHAFSWGVGGQHGIPGGRNIVIENMGSSLTLQNALTDYDLTLEQGAFQAPGSDTGKTLTLNPGTAVLWNTTEARTMQFAGFARHPGAILALTVRKDGNTVPVAHNVRFTGDVAESVAAQLVGGTGSVYDTPQTTQIPILPWAGFFVYGGDTEYRFNNSYADATRLVTYTEQDGFVSVTNLHYDLATATRDDNVCHTNGFDVALEADAACNALVFAAPYFNNALNLNGHTLRLQSGKMISGNTKPRIVGGTLDIGARTLYMCGRQDFSVSAVIASANTDPDFPVIVTSSSSGCVSLWGNNSALTGTIHVAQGNLSAGASSLNPGIAVELAAGTAFPVNYGSATTCKRVGGKGTIRFGNSHGNNKLHLGYPESALNGIIVGADGCLAPGAKDMEGASRRGTLLVGANVGKLVMESGSQFAVDITAPDECTSLSVLSANVPVTLGGDLVVNNRAANPNAGIDLEWVVLRTLQSETADTVTGSFDHVTPGYRVERVALGDHATKNAVVLHRNNPCTILLVR